MTCLAFLLVYYIMKELNLQVFRDMFTVIVFVIILALVVLFHELGHFITARKSGMRVYEFGFGFPPRALGVYRDPLTKKFVWIFGNKNYKSTNLMNTVGGEKTNEEEQYPATLYSLNWLPLGGFCKIKGENGEQSVEPDSFGFQKAWKKIIVLAAGVTMNVVLAGILLSIGFIVGLPADISLGLDSQAVITESPHTMIQMVETGSPADKSGIRYGDRLVSVDNLTGEVLNSEKVAEYVRSHEASKNINLVIDRQGQNISFDIKPEKINQADEYPRLGFSMADVAIISYPWYIALYKGFVAAGVGVVNVFLAFYFLIKGLVLGQGLAFSVSGPVGIAVIVGESARLGFNYLINVAAMISLSLAVINILPIPALDGGRILFIIIGKILRRPVPIKYEQLAHTIGFILLMILIIIVTGRDIWGLIK